MNRRIGSSLARKRLLQHVNNRLQLRFEPLEARRLLAAGLFGEYFNDIDLTAVADTRVDPVINFPQDWGAAPSGTGVIPDDRYSERWTGFVKIDQPGDWTFYTTSNDGVRLWVDDTLVILNWNQHAVTENVATINLDAGWHPIELHHFQQDGSAEITLSFSGPGQSKTIIPSTHLNTEDPQFNDPVAFAGADQTILLPDSEVTLNGSGTDDGTIVSYQWIQESGPNTAVLSGATAPDLTASSLVEGTYTFSLTVTDNEANTDTDSALVHVVSTGGGGVVSGELKKWHKVSITFDGPVTSETAVPNPFTDYRLNVVFSHTDTGKSYLVPGFYAADGNAANTSASGGAKWRVHFAPDETGEWIWTASFRTGTNVAVSDDPSAGSSAGFFDQAAGVINVADTDKSSEGDDFRGKGRLRYVGGHYLQFAETGEYFLKQGADSPENLLAFEDFDGPFASDGQNDHLVKDWAPHVADWNPGDPTWAGGKGKGIIGAVNYLASEGLNAFSFIPMNIEGDDRNVFPYLNYNERLRMDISRLDQWEVVFEHADRNGMFLHFKTQETENELLLNSGNLGTERKLYYRELIARFAHHLALNWNLGEEVNDATTAQKRAWAEYFHDHDPYQHHIVIHNGSDHFDLLGTSSDLTGFSLQTTQIDFSTVHLFVSDYLQRSRDALKPWAVAADEPGDAQNAIRPDNNPGNSHEDGRKNALWGTLMAGGWGNEWYFGSNHPQSDSTLNDFRSRDNWWDYGRHALQFFNENEVPFWEMQNDNQISSASDDYGLVKHDEAYVVYLKSGGTTNLDLAGASGEFSVRWFDPRNGGALQTGSVQEVTGGSNVSLGVAPHSTTDDWAILVARPDSVGQAPFGGTPRLITDGALIQAEDFDEGGEGVAYHDTTSVNEGGGYRPSEGVDIQVTTDTGGGFNVGWIRDSEYLEYSVTVAPGVYNIHARVASQNSNPGDFKLLIGDGPQGSSFTELGTFPVESTAGWQNWTTISLGDIDLAPHAGVGKILRFEKIGGQFNMNWMDFDLVGEPPTNSPPSVDAGADQQIQLPAQAVLDATVSDDGNPVPPGFLTLAWTQVNGPGTVNFADAGAADTTATFSTPGTYTLRLTADDGDQIAFDDTVITVAEDTTLTFIPTDDAYLQDGVGFSDAFLKVENDGRVRTSYLKFDLTGLGLNVTSATLNLTVHADSGSGTLRAWSGSGSGWTESTLTPSNAPQPSALLDSASGSFSVGQVVEFDVTSAITSDGIYSFIIEMDAGGNDVWFGSSEGAVSPRLDIEQDGGPPPNLPPSVNAGVDHQIQLPDNDVQLDGTVSDDGNPVPPGFVSTTWTQVSGPGTVTFGNANSVDTIATFGAPGTYILRLTADDGDEVATDDAVVVVQPSSAIALTPIDDAYLENGSNFNNSFLKIENDGRERISYLKFDVSGVGGQQVANATLTLTVSSDPGSGTVRVLAGQSSSWTESTLTPANAPLPGALLDTASGAFSVGQTVTLDVTSAVNGDGTLSLILELAAGGNDVWFSSSEGANSPILEIETAPLAGSANVRIVASAGLSDENLSPPSNSAAAIDQLSRSTPTHTTEVADSVFASTITAERQRRTWFGASLPRRHNAAELLSTNDRWSATIDDLLNLLPPDWRWRSE